MINEKQHRGLQHKEKINGYNTLIGVIDSTRQTSCYLEIGGYVKPIEKGDLNDSMKLFERRLRYVIDNALNQLLQGQIRTDRPCIKIVDWADTDTTVSLRRVNSTYTYFSIQITMFFNQNINIRDKDQKDKLLLLFYSLTDFFDDTKELTFKPTCK